MQTLASAGLPPLRFFDHVAGTILPLRNAVDERGKSREDYQQELIEFALRQRPKVLPSHAPQRVLAAWTWRRAANLRRDRSRAVKFQAVHEVLDVKPTEVNPIPDLENKACVRYLEKRMSPHDLHTAKVVAVLDFAGAASTMQLSRPTLAARMAEVSAIARALLTEE